MTRFKLFDLDETFSKASHGFSLPTDTIFSSLKNLHVLQDSIKDLKDTKSLERVPEV